MTRRGAAHIPNVEEEHKGTFGLMEGNPYSIRVNFFPVAATCVAERDWSKYQRVTTHKDSSIPLGMKARSLAEVITWVLRFVDAAELLSPKWLRSELAQHVLAIATI